MDFSLFYLFQSGLFSGFIHSLCPGAGSGSRVCLRVRGESSLCRGEGLEFHTQPWSKQVSLTLTPESYFPLLQKALEAEFGLLAYPETLT